MSEEFKTEIEIAVRWWSDVLQSKSPRKFNNGDNSRTGDLTMMLATMLANDAPAPSGDKFSTFEEALRRRLIEATKGGRSADLMTDYGPMGILSDAMDEAGIRSSLAPIKTIMWVRKDLVTVSMGYGAPSETLFIVARADMRFLDYVTLNGAEVTRQYTSVEQALADAERSIRNRNERENKFWSVPLGGTNLETGEPLTIDHVLTYYHAALAARLMDYDSWGNQDRAKVHREKEEVKAKASLEAFMKMGVQ